jgi:phosphatidylglycerol phospholipase C
VPDWETDLAPRLILGLWHTSFILPARQHLPLLHVTHITKSLSLATHYFASHVSGFSVAFPLLLTPEGEAFRQMCLREGKNFGVWTVNAESEMCVAARLGCTWILTDRPRVWRDLRIEVRPSPLIVCVHPS